MRRNSVLFTALFVLAGCSHLGGLSMERWNDTTPDDPALSASLIVPGDPEVQAHPCFPAPMCWHTLVVIQNTNTFPVNVVFQTVDAIRYSTKTIAPGGYAALRIGPDATGFRFRRAIATEEPSKTGVVESFKAPELVNQSLPDWKLMITYANASRL